MKKATARGRRGKRRRLILRVTLRDIEPAIWRRVCVPDHFTLHQFHRVLQIVFARLDYHLYEFRVGERRFQEPDPEAEEVVEDATSSRLADFGLGVGSRFTYVYDFGDNWKHDVVVERLLPMPAGLGHDWSPPQLLDGARAAPPEDAGGPPGYETMVAALRDPDHPEHEGYRQWVGPTYDPDTFDPWSLDHALVLAAAWGAI